MSQGSDNVSRSNLRSLFLHPTACQDQSLDFDMAASDGHPSPHVLVVGAGKTVLSATFILNLMAPRLCGSSHRPASENARHFLHSLRT